ncbi:MAG: HDOD domain-containing protein, partial [Verrucomicrobiota bacterium]
AFPEEFANIHRQTYETDADLRRAERAEIGWDYPQVGAYYLERNQLDKGIVDAVRWQCTPERAHRNSVMAAAIQVSRYLLHTAEVAGIEQIERPDADSPEELSGWQILFRRRNRSHSLVMASLKHALNRLPMTLKGML